MKEFDFAKLMGAMQLLAHVRSDDKPGPKLYPTGGTPQLLYAGAVFRGGAG
jgi:hypothetical protein